MIRVTFRNKEAPATLVHSGNALTIAGPMMLLDGKQIARKWESVGSPWLDAHGRGWDRIEIEVAP